MIALAPPRNVRRGVRVAVLIAIASAVVAVPVRSAGSTQLSSARKSVWDGVYTEAQAGRGKVAYEKSCSECHGDDMRGVEDVRSPALIGQRFELVWDHTTVGDLLARVSNTMPQSAPGSLDHDEYLDIVAFLLKSNTFPAGSQELRGEFTELQTIELTLHKK